MRPLVLVGIPHNKIVKKKVRESDSKHKQIVLFIQNKNKRNKNVKNLH